MTSLPRHVLLGGGTGFVGSSLRYLLEQRGYEVTVISRMPGPKSVTWFEVCSSGLPAAVTAVVNLAGQNILDTRQRWSPGFKQNVWNSRVNTTHTLAQAITHAKIKPAVFVTMSGVGIYKPDPDVVYDEESDITDTFDFLSKLAVEWEKASHLPDAVKVRVVNVRSGVVLGRQGGMIKEMFLPFFFGLGGPIGTGRQWMPWIHVFDLCNLFIFAIENQKVEGVLNAVAPQVVTNEEFTRAFAKALRRPAFFRIPEFLITYLFGAERAKIMTEGQRVHANKLRDLGFNFRYKTIEEATKDCAKLFYSKKKPFV